MEEGTHSTAKRARSSAYRPSTVLDIVTPALEERPDLGFAAIRTTVPKCALGEEQPGSACKPLQAPRGAGAVSLAELPAAAAAEQARVAAPAAVNSTVLLDSADAPGAETRLAGEGTSVKGADHESRELCVCVDLTATIPSLNVLLRPCLSRTEPARGYPARSGVTALGRPPDWPRGEAVASLGEMAAVAAERTRLEAMEPEADLLDRLCAEVEWGQGLYASDSEEEPVLCTTRCTVLPEP